MQSGGSNPPDSSPASPGSWATWAWRKTWRRTRWSRRSSSGPSRACRTILVPGSWRPPNTGPSTSCAARRCRAGSMSIWGASSTSGRSVRSPHSRRRSTITWATIQQRIVRAKRTLAAARVPFEVPPGAELAQRLESVLEVIYLIFNEGYSATAGAEWVRPALCEDALRLGRILAELAPGEAEVHGLVALMEIQASRMRARVGPGGEPILLLAQDRGRWDHLLIGRGLAALERAE